MSKFTRKSESNWAIEPAHSSPSAQMQFPEAEKTWLDQYSNWRTLSNSSNEPSYKRNCDTYAQICRRFDSQVGNKGPQLELAASHLQSLFDTLPSIWKMTQWE